ncbi:hypothetical protein E3N88_38415 [Mikania micrantha]|uniref:Uncharacterized protein n=1 Tax=Mikania micrantha TaxID=192012 RepID=A0A5N6LTW5_9ASTR|nr:hypothetical protein E3N88_38415 [Mikania micrantha]
MELVSPSGKMAVEDLSSTPEHSVDTNKGSPKMVGQLEEAVNAEVNSEAAAVSEGPVIIDDSSTEELLANEPVGEATGSISSGVKLTADDKGKRNLTPEEEAEQEERIPTKKKGRPDTAQDEERIRLSALLEEKGYDFDAVLLWSVPQMVAELDKVQQEEQAAAASKAQKKLTKTQKDKAYRDSLKAFLLEYGFHARQLGPMKNSTKDMHIRDIKAKVARGELPSIEQIHAQRASLNLGLGLGGGVRIEFPLSGGSEREKKSCVGRKGKAAKRTIVPDPERQSMADERRPNPPRTEAAGPEPPARADDLVGSNVEDQQAREQRSETSAQDRPRFRRRKSIAKRKKRTNPISPDFEPEAVISVPEVTPEAAPTTTQSQEDLRDIHGLMHEHSYIPLVKWSFNAQEKIFILTNYNGVIKLVNLVQLMVLANPYVLDLDKLPLNNPDNGSDGRVGSKWVKARAHVLRGVRKPRYRIYTDKQPSEGRSSYSEAELLPKSNSFQPKAVQDKLFGRMTKTKTSEVYPLTKTVADYFHSTKGTDTRHAGNAKFKLGFFSPGNSKNRYLRIWFANSLSPAFAWVANLQILVQTQDQNTLKFL